MSVCVASLKCPNGFFNMSSQVTATTAPRDEDIVLFICKENKLLIIHTDPHKLSVQNGNIGLCLKTNSKILKLDSNWTEKSGQICKDRKINSLVHRNQIFSATLVKFRIRLRHVI